MDPWLHKSPSNGYFWSHNTRPQSIGLTKIGNLQSQFVELEKRERKMAESDRTSCVASSCCGRHLLTELSETFSTSDEPHSSPAKPPATSNMNTDTNDAYKSKSLCGGCNEPVGDVHQCPACGASMHPLRGTPLGLEGFGQPIMCPSCSIHQSESTPAQRQIRPPQEQRQVCLRTRRNGDLSANSRLPPQQSQVCHQTKRSVNLQLS